MSYPKSQQEVQHENEQAHIQPKVLKQNVQGKKEWRLEETISSLVSHISPHGSPKEDWYFDSGCSRHMTGIKTLLEDMKSYSSKFVTFGDGARGKIN